MPGELDDQDVTLLTREDLRTMSPAEIVKAHESGFLDHLTGVRTVETSPMSIPTEDDTAHDRMRRMTSSELVHSLRTTDLQRQLEEERRQGIS